MRYDTMNSELGPILYSRDDKGIAGVHFLDSDKPLTQGDGWRRDGNDPLLKEARSQLTAYLSGKRRNFSLPLSMDGWHRLPGQCVEGASYHPLWNNLVL